MDRRQLRLPKSVFQVEPNTLPRFYKSMYKDAVELDVVAHKRMPHTYLLMTEAGLNLVSKDFMKKE